MLEAYLVNYCAPTLADVKTGSLVAYPYAAPAEILPSVLAGNLALNGHGLFLEPIKFGTVSTLMYVYRKDLLAETLEDRKISDFLHCFGYGSGGLQEHIDFLKRRLALDGAFPHEIGVFLGYPIEDVTAFIDNKGQNCRLNGWWKVYYNVKQTGRLFARYSDCAAACSRLYRSGLPLKEIAACSKRLKKDELF